ncbi:hypothetical protein CVT26_009636 [Gymnopilus dilepis]|uniref:Uncharacterized protein n=1 Tax=Gymnopilus dilepis TaxID=231916 RepID=A0A409VKV1_9AGAR|nr:hypothetical protein CVT26_009636 [Gymnopilus dilepis]
MLQSPPPLDAVDRGLIEKTIALADALYFYPEVSSGPGFEEAYGEPMDNDSFGGGDYDSDSSPSDFGDNLVEGGGDGDGGSTVRPLGAGQGRRRATVSETQKSADYCRNLLFGHDDDLTAEEKSLQHEILMSERSMDAPGIGGSVHSIQNWRQGVR